MGEDNRHEMMESLFGAESGESEEDPEPTQHSNNSDSNNSNNSGRDEEGQGEGGGDVELESEAEVDRGESEAGESEGAHERESDEEHDAASDGGGEEAEQSVSGSETSHHDRTVESENEVEEARDPSEQGEEDQQVSGGVADARDVFGDSDEEEQDVAQQSRDGTPQASTERAQSEGERSEREGTPHEDVAVDEEDRYESEEDAQAERKREKPVGPPLDLEVSLKQPPGLPDQLNLVRISNIMGIETKPFDPKTYKADKESQYLMDDMGHKQRLRLEDNVARWRVVKSRNGTISFESNARFVKWSDGSMQLLLGSEVLDLSVQDSRQDQSHLFIRHPKGLLQSQGRLLHKMKFMPSSLSSKSHRLLTALVDSRHKKVFKVKNVIISMDPDKEKEEKEKAAEQRIRSKSDLQRKQDRINRKYTHLPTREREAQMLSAGYLEGALEEEEEYEDFAAGSRRSAGVRRFREQLDAEGRAEKRIMNAKRQAPTLKQTKDRRHPPSRRELLQDTSESEREESAYETDEDEEEEVGMAADYREEEDDEADDLEHDRKWSDKGKGRLRESTQERRRDDDDRKKRDREEEPEISPPRKPAQRRRVVVSDSDEE